MCIDSDLFGEVVITYDDVEKWLRCIPRLNNGNRLNQIEMYINSYNVVSKILQAKLDNSFYCLNEPDGVDNSNLSHMVRKAMKPRFKPLHFIPYSRAKFA